MKIATRAARADEKPAIWRLYESALKHHIEAIWGWDAAWQAADFDKAFSASSTRVVEVDGRFAGYLQLDAGALEDYLDTRRLDPTSTRVCCGIVSNWRQPVSYAKLA